MPQTKRSILFLAVLALAFALAPLSSDAGDKVFKGYITDSQCALNVHSLSQSHKEMLQTKNAGTTSADCVWYCVKQRGGRFVLQDKNKVYKLDDQNISQDLAGKKVQITGVLDAQTNTIHVGKIEIVNDDSHTDY
jgi:type 1 fimbria pilin